MSTLSELVIDMNRAIERLARVQSHHIFLSKCLEHNVIPNGMRLQFGTATLPEVPFLLHYVEQTLYSTSFNIVQQLNTTYESLCKDCESKLHSIMLNIFHSCNFV